MGSETLPSAGYILLDESSIPFYSTSNGHGWIDSASDPDQEYIHFMGSETHPSACNILMGSETLPSAGYILLDESSIPFYSTSNAWLDRLV